jgi:predicted outer membrane protein
MSSLRDANGAAFDTAYMDCQVEAHQNLLAALDQQLLPAATDQQLRDALTKMRSTVEAHLKEAKAIRADLGNPSAR